MKILPLDCNSFIHLFIHSFSSPASLSSSIPPFFLTHVMSFWNAVLHFAALPSITSLYVSLDSRGTHSTVGVLLLPTDMTWVSNYFWWMVLGAGGAGGIIHLLPHNLAAAGGLVWEQVSGQMPAAAEPCRGEQTQTAGLDFGRGFRLGCQAHWPALAGKACSKAGPSYKRIGRCLYPHNAEKWVQRASELKHPLTMWNGIALNFLLLYS